VAEQDKSQKTEEATPKRKEKLRKDGKIAKSPDVAAAGVLAFGGLAIAWVASSAGRTITGFADRAFRLRDAHEPLQLLGALKPVLMDVVLPVALAAMVGAIVATSAQTKGFFSFDQLAPKPERFDPRPQLKKMLPGKESGVELLKQTLKLFAIGAVVYQLIRDALPSFLGLGASTTASGVALVASTVEDVALYGAVAFAVVAAADYALARRKHAVDARMSLRDVKDEHKQQEGDPFVKRRMRQRMREAGGRRVAPLEEATVLVTNPTHISIALRYDPEKDAAPVMIAKGVDKVALDMRKRARRAGVPIVENRPFARAMYRDAKLGEALPADLFGPAATVIAHVMQLKAPRRRGAEA